VGLPTVLRPRVLLSTTSSPSRPSAVCGATSNTSDTSDDTSISCRISVKAISVVLSMSSSTDRLSRRLCTKFFAPDDPPLDNAFEERIPVHESRRENRGRVGGMHLQTIPKVTSTAVTMYVTAPTPANGQRVEYFHLLTDSHGMS
jgi:hypothetical protein